ncbi:MAG TPA: hypothetical protein VGN90_01245 [Pyrinomonadaceae bacterium]|jgi:hypothetical protein|nr:hypothetical protein [Pyrinomonadaceae bacterium]
MLALSFPALSLLAGIAWTSQTRSQTKITDNPGSADKRTGKTAVEQTVSKQELPLSRRYKFIKPNPSSEERLPRLNSTEASGTSKNAKMRIGVLRPFESPLNILDTGSMFHVPEGDVLVQAIVSEGAASIRLHFTALRIPSGARLFVYSIPNSNEVYGPYVKTSFPRSNSFWTPPVRGDGVIVEYFVPHLPAKKSRNQAPFVIAELSHIFPR